MSTDSQGQQTSDVLEEDFLMVDASDCVLEQSPSIQDTVLEMDPYPLTEYINRNVLILGSSRAGKTTLIGVMKDPTYQGKQMSLFSDTPQPRFHKFTLEDADSSQVYSMNVIDTPGLKEVKQEDEKARSDEDILKMVSFCLKNELKEIHVLVAVVSFSSGITKADIDSIRQIIDLFRHESLKTILCVTRSECLSKDYKANIVKELSNHQFFKPLILSGNFKVIFSGNVGVDFDATSARKLYGTYKNVLEMRSELLHEIFNAENPVNLAKLPISENATKAVKTIIEEFKAVIENPILEDDAVSVDRRLNDTIERLESYDAVFLMHPTLRIFVNKVLEFGSYVIEKCRGIKNLARSIFR